MLEFAHFDPKELSFGKGLLGMLHKTSVLQGVWDYAQLRLPRSGKAGKRFPAVASGVFPP